MSTQLLCRCGYPTHEVYGERCENCFALAMERAGDSGRLPHIALRWEPRRVQPMAGMSLALAEALEERGIDSATGRMKVARSA